MNPLLSLLPESKKRNECKADSAICLHKLSDRRSAFIISSQSFYVSLWLWKICRICQYGESGQDFAAVRIHKSVCCFVLCDGVGLSYRGDFAARYLGSSLLDWMERGQDLSADQLRGYLERLAGTAAEELDQRPLDHESGLMRSVLEDKRRQGSQSMYICGKIELPKRGSRGRLRLAWQGDSRLRLWNGAEEISELFDHTFLQRSAGQQVVGRLVGSLIGTKEVYPQICR